MAKIPTTEELISADGTVDEKAAGAAIDAVIEQDKAEDQQAGLGDEETTSEADEKPPAKEDKDATVDDQSDGDDDWVTSEDIAELIESLEYSDKVMAEFTGPDEFKRHVRLLDQELKKERVRPGDEAERALEVDELSRQKDVRRQQAEKQYRENGKFAEKPEELPELDPDEFDERLVEVLKSRDQRLESAYAKIAELEELVQGSTQNAILQEFDNIVDGLGHDEIFGNSEELKPAERKAREKLFEEYKEIFNIQEARGKPVSGKGANRALVLRALNLEFADEITKKTRRDLTSKAKKQMARRTGSGHRLSDRYYDGPIEKDPELHRLFKEMEAENG